MTVVELTNALSLKTYSAGDPSAEIHGGYTGDLLSWVMGRAKEGDAWVTIMTNINVIAVAHLTGVACVVIAEGAEPDAVAVQRAEQQGIALLGSECASFELSAEIARIFGK